MWEYKEFVIDTSKGTHEPIKTLNELGKQGWELCIYKFHSYVFRPSYDMLVIMKRKIH